MISSLNGFGGLSASDVLKLFGANAATSTPAGETSATSAPSSSDDSASSANDPASAIKAILAEAQINQSPTATLGGADTGAQFYSETIGAAYAAASATSSNESVQTTQAYMSASDDAASVTATAATGVVTGGLNGLGYSTSLSFNSVAASSASNADDSASVDSFQATVALGDDSVTVGFSVQGLGPLIAQNNEIVAVGGQGQLQDFFQMDVTVDDQLVGLSFNVGGLDGAQAQALGAAFEKATSAPASAEVSSAVPSNQYTQTFGPNFSVNFVDILGYD